MRILTLAVLLLLMALPPGIANASSNDCIGALSDGQMHCVSPVTKPSNPDQPADGDNWQYGNCREQGADNCPFWAFNCCAAGGAWTGDGSPYNCGGMHCTGLPQGIWAGGGGFASEGLAIQVTDAMGKRQAPCSINACPINASSTAWGETIGPNSNCATGGTGYTLGIKTIEYARRAYDGNVADPLTGMCTTPFHEDYVLTRSRTVECPIGSVLWGTKCVRAPALMCPATAHPVALDIGAKLWSEALSSFPAAFGGLNLKYNSLGFSPTDNTDGETAMSYWKLSFTQRVEKLDSELYALARVREADGRYTYYATNGNELIKTERSSTRLVRVPTSGPVTGWTREDRLGTTEIFDAAGRLLEVRNAGGNKLAITWTNGVLSRITDEAGRYVDLEWQNNLLARIFNPQGNIAQFTYSAKRQLEVLRFADGTERRYTYGPAVGAYLHPEHLLAEIRDGNTLMASYQYDENGRASQTILHSSPAQVINYAYSYHPDGIFTTTVTNALGATESYRFLWIAGAWRVTDTSTNCASCGSKAANTTYDEGGLPTSRTDFRGQVVEFEHDAIGRQTVRVEGRDSGGQFTCPYGSGFFGSNIPLPQCTETCASQFPFAGSIDAEPYGWPGWQVSCPFPPAQKLRTTTTTWHTNFRTPQSITLVNNLTSATESVRKTAVNARGQITASCAIDPTIPAAMAYTCGASTNAPTGVRQTRTTYCEANAADFGTTTCPFAGFVKNVNGPRTDVTDTVTRTYYAADHVDCATNPAACAYRKGDTWKLTNAASQVTEFLSYDSAGRLLRQKDANGVITDLAYHARGWLISRSVRANADGTPNPTLDAVTRIEYEPYGEVKRVIQPDNSGMEFCRDPGHRIAAVVQTTFAQSSRCSNGAPLAGTDSIVYTLDAAGNRVKEEVRDSSGAIKRLLARQYTTLSQLRSLINAPYAGSADLDDPSVKKTTYQRDQNDNVELTTDPLGRVTDNDYDPLNRLIQSIQDKDTAAATGEIAATVKYEYDARDNLRKVIDPKNLPTEYVYDGLGNQTSLVSPDTGTTTYTYDAAGNRKNQTDARAIVTDYTYDALNRLKTISYPAEATKNITFTYDTVQSGCLADESASKGRLVRIVDQTGQTRLCFDLRGNLRRKVQVTGGRTLTTEYRYNLANRLIGMTYPSGLVVTYGRDAQGRISTVGLSRGSYSLPLVTGVNYLPFGPVGQINFGNGQSLNKAWDQNYWPDAISGNVLGYDFTTNEVGNITEVASVSEGTQKLGYDRLDRLNEVRHANLALIEAYSYDATGNRLSQQIGANPVTNYSYPAQNHRLTQVGAAARSFDAVGNTLTGVPGYEADSATYDARNRLTQVATGASAQLLSNYNGRGERVLASQGAPAPALPTTSAAWTTSAGVRGYVYDEVGQVISMLIAGSALRYEEIVWLDNTPIGRVESSTSAVTAVHAIHSDHLNTPRALANAQTQGGQAAGTLVWRWKLNSVSATGSNAFGAQPAEENPDGNGTSLRFDLRFPGQQWDAAVGLNYNYFRDYEPGTGRYVESDPIGLRGGTGTYTYANSNPYAYFDRLGLFGGSINLRPSLGGLYNPMPPSSNSCDPKCRWEKVYVQSSLDVYVFSFSTTFTVDGDIFSAGGVGASHPTPMPSSFGGSLVVGWMWLCDDQDRQAVVNNFLAGASFGGGAYMGGGGGFATNQAGSAINTGIGVGWGVNGTTATHMGNVFGGK